MELGFKHLLTLILGVQKAAVLCIDENCDFKSRTVKYSKFVIFGVGPLCLRSPALQMLYDMFGMLIADLITGSPYGCLRKIVRSSFELGCSSILAPEAPCSSEEWRQGYCLCTSKRNAKDWERRQGSKFHEKSNNLIKADHKSRQQVRHLAKTRVPVCITLKRSPRWVSDTLIAIGSLEGVAAISPDLAHLQSYSHPRAPRALLIAVAIETKRDTVINGNLETPRSSITTKAAKPILPPEDTQLLSTRHHSSRAPPVSKLVLQLKRGSHCASAVQDTNLFSELREKSKTMYILMK
ncbi:hypothetical protein JTE90_021183 [Oedothorax gibbosus]|uniref:Uncharacterized protein n=1 Tax=Oedothorax gibbosus TaxID=931172 RepID=A0AAV6V7G0_9ARAC|nr:hypothetical protein JTE90_021183 [Oedothorax gibbosus]